MKNILYFLLLLLVTNTYFFENLKASDSVLFKFQKVLRTGSDKEIQKFINKTNWKKDYPLDNTLGLPAVSLLVSQNKESFLDDLVDQGADISALSKQKNTVLHIAAGQGKSDLVKKLVEKYKVPFSKDILGQTPIHYAADRKNNPLLSFLVKAYPEHVDDKDNNKETALFLATRKNDIHNIRVLLKAKANPRLVNKNGVNIYLYSIRMNYTYLKKLFRRAVRKNHFKRG